MVHGSLENRGQLESGISCGASRLAQVGDLVVVQSMLAAVVGASMAFPLPAAARLPSHPGPSGVADPDEGLWLCCRARSRTPDRVN